MIEAWFERWTNHTTPGAGNIPAFFPSEEILELAELAGLSMDDLFSIHIPGGASRHSRIRCLVPRDQIASLYLSNGPYGKASATFHWRERNSATVYTASKVSMDVILLPPRPIFGRSDAAGVMMVEAVDIRYWWKQTRNRGAFNAPENDIYTGDGRFLSWSSAKTLPELLQWMWEELDDLRGATFTASKFLFDFDSYLPNAALIDRLADYELWPTMSTASRIDLLLSLTGYVLNWIPVPTPVTGYSYKVFKIEDDSAKLDAMMSGAGSAKVGKRAYCGGLEPSSANASTTDELLSIWKSTIRAQINRSASKMAMEIPFRSTESATDYHGASNPLLFEPLDFPASKVALNAEMTVNTARARADDLGTAAGSLPLPLMRETRPWLSLPDTTVPSINPDGDIILTPTYPSPPSWNPANLENAIRDNYVNRLQMSIGSIAWMGWPELDGGAYRSTMLRYGLAYRSRKFVDERPVNPDEDEKRVLVPLTVTVCDDQDWVFGPSGLDDPDPRQMIFSKGIAHARRLSSGALIVDVAAPNTRVFAAEILASEAHPTKAWNWRYKFRELEPVATGGVWTQIGDFAREADAFIALNTVESGNVYIAAGAAGNLIAPGVSQADYAAATVEPVPVSNGTIVMMVEQFPANMAYDGAAYLSTPQNASARSKMYWFSVPNAVKVTCE
jgi:hypothetical protein